MGCIWKCGRLALLLLSSVAALRPRIAAEAFEGGGAMAGGLGPCFGEGGDGATEVSGDSDRLTPRRWRRRLDPEVESNDPFTDVRSEYGPEPRSRSSSKPTPLSWFRTLRVGLLAF